VKNLATLVALLVSLAAPVVAGPLEEADAAYKRGDYSTAFGALKVGQRVEINELP
jgi:hypothetical protein